MQIFEIPWSHFLFMQPELETSSTLEQKDLTVSRQKKMKT